RLMSDFQPNGFRGVQWRTAAKTDEPIASRLAVAVDSVEHVALGRIGLYAGVNNRARNGLRYSLKNDPSGQTPVGAEKRPCDASFGQLLRQFFDRPGPEQNRGGKAKGRKAHSLKIISLHPVQSMKCRQKSPRR